LLTYLRLKKRSTGQLSSRSTSESNEDTTLEEISLSNIQIHEEEHNLHPELAVLNDQTMHAKFRCPTCSLGRTSGAVALEWCTKDFIKVKKWP